ncbi:Xaa-Pro aminopeptidase [Lewinella marina]|uniref:Xaa-Pro aminopeptidase n=1 Tax=Neolewinella marina TaxID=438751 RepID=A0A2G0CI05_9BACT|nr:M24 family metallopeptidase [Neolewinella marina]NJB85276.1 Xaa-Pro aminopeptidase [Neolewinella marina]PHK99599.1 Xaa-Pro aminopeptidase [Neolewinella marina]
MRSPLLFLLLILSFTAVAQSAMPVILTLKQQGELQDRWLKERFETVVPQIMREEGIDMWVMITREYNEDAVVKTMLPSTWMGARRTTMLVVYDPGAGKPLETLACARYDVGEVFKKAWDPEQQPDQWQRLAEIIRERSPRKIAVNRSEEFGLADGISSYHYDRLLEVLPANLTSRVVSGERLAIRWLETRTPSEMVVYRQIMQVAHQIIREAFSEQVIQPGVTTTEEVVWYLRERVRELGLDSWFHPTVDVQRADNQELYGFSGRPGADVIQPGDLLHCDFGITYCGLNTDTQENAYVLKPGETEAPAYLVAAHRRGLRLMDILTGEYATGKTGNELLLNTIRTAEAEGLRPSIYSHPIGYHGHGAGPTIGLWDQQEGVPIRGDYPVFPHTAYSIELNNKVFLPEWNKDVRIMLEEDGYWDGESFRYLNGRQEELYLVPRQAGK